MQINFDPANFKVVIVDEEHRAFGFVGPMRHDSKITDRVARLNRLGRRLRICGPVDDSITTEQYKDQIARQTGCRFSTELMLETVATNSRAILRDDSTYFLQDRPPMFR